ncbi:MAG: MBL fold metallo-hydrolase [Firmicutes bacterium]|nr:MBL fold metallo-hydrolase [Bacillota bacterium]
MIIPKDNGFFKNFQGHDRFDVPEPVYRVTGGPGGESYLILGSDKTALFDCGMACFSRELICNIHEVLDPLGRKPDYILMSHSHYDHIGALPYILREWPEARVCGAAKCAKVFCSEEAKATIEELGNTARNVYGCDCPPVTAEGLRIDIILEDGDEISLGDETVRFYETKGHTDCSAAYMILPQKILFASESASQLGGPGDISTSCLKSFEQSIRSAEKMAALGAEYIICMHYGVIPQSYNEQFFTDYIEEAEWEWGLIKRCIKLGLTDEEVSDVHDIFYWNERKALAHPYEAHHLNTMIIIKRVRKEMEEENG